jgi:hypothetical protein
MEARVRVIYQGMSGRVLEERQFEVLVGDAPVEEDAAVLEAIEALEAKWIGGRVLVRVLAD